MDLIEIVSLISIISISYFAVLKKTTFIRRKVKKYANILPMHYALCILVWNLSALLIVFFLDLYLDIRFPYIFHLASFVVSILGSVFINVKFKAREHLEKIYYLIMFLCTLFTVAITACVIWTIFFEAAKFFSSIAINDFILGKNWNPQNDIESYKANSFGALPLFSGTLLVTLIAIGTAAPIGIFAAIYITEYATKKFRKIVRPLIEVLAGIPTVVYGYFAAFFVAPFFKEVGNMLSLNVSAESALATGIVMGIMIMPYILSLGIDVIMSVPRILKDASLAIGATKAETILKIIIPASIPGLCSAILLATSRAIGETMIVTMAAGLNANLTLNPIESVTTVTAQIVSLLTGDQEFNSTKTLAAFALAFALFTLTFILNIIAQIIVEKSKLKYE